MSKLKRIDGYPEAGKFYWRKHKNGAWSVIGNYRFDGEPPYIMECGDDWDKPLTPDMELYGPLEPPEDAA